jgi:signal peptidase II
MSVARMSDRDSQPGPVGETSTDEAKASAQGESDAISRSPEAAPSPDAASSPEASPDLEGARAPERSITPDATPKAPPHPGYAFLAIVSIATLAADLGSKHWAKLRLEQPKVWTERRIEVIQGFFSFVFAKNRGGAWGILQDEPESIRRPFFLGISVLAIVFIVSLYRKLTPQQWALKWGLPLVLGGALGNLVNRIQLNYVVDFIDFSYKGHHWPTFNVADIAIVAGVGLMAIDMFTPRRDASSTKTIVPAVQPSADVAREAKPATSGDAAPRET